MILGSIESGKCRPGSSCPYMASVIHFQSDLPLAKVEDSRRIKIKQLAYRTSDNIKQWDFLLKIWIKQIPGLKKQYPRRGVLIEK